MNKNEKLFDRGFKNDSSDIPHILVSTIAGGLIGLTAALLLAPQSKRKTSHDIFSSYRGVADKIEDIGENVMHKGHDVINKVSDCAENVKEYAVEFLDYCSPIKAHSKLLLFGIISGGLIGASSILLLKTAAQSKDGAAKMIKKSDGKVYRNMGSVDWLEIARKALLAINGQVEEKTEGVDEKDDAHHASDTVQDVIGLAQQGIKMWKNLNSRR